MLRGEGLYRVRDWGGGGMSAGGTAGPVFCWRGQWMTANVLPCSFWSRGGVSLGHKQLYVKYLPDL